MAPLMSISDQNSAPDSAKPRLSVVAPMYNEAEGAGILVGEIAKALSEIPHEIVIVDDGSSDATVKVLLECQKTHRRLRVVRHQQNAGQSRALHTGVEAARADIVATLDGDGQNDPADIAMLFKRFSELNDGDQRIAVAGERRNRQDSAAKKIASKWANGVRRRVLRDGAADTGCGLKVFLRRDFLRLPYFDHMHRYLPALFRRDGVTVYFEPVSHRPRVFGASKYTNFGRFMVALRDLLGVVWLLGRARDPGSIDEDSLE